MDYQKPANTQANLELRLRRLTLDDVDTYFDVFDDNRDHLASHDTYFADIRTLGQVREMLAPYAGRLTFGIMNRGDFIGSAALIHRGASLPPEITYWVDRNHIRRGVATFACRQLVDLGFKKGHDEIEAFIVPANHASIKTAERVGFQHNRTLENGLVYSIRQQAQ